MRRAGVLNGPLRNIGTSLFANSRHTVTTANRPLERKTMSVDKSKDSTPKKPATEAKAAESKAVEVKAVESKAETSPKTESKPDAAPKKQGMGEGQKPVSKAYKDNWNDIFGKKKKR